MENENRIDNLYDEDFLFSEPDLDNTPYFVEQILKEEDNPKKEEEEEVDIESDTSDVDDEDIDILEMVDEEEPEIVNIDNEEFKEVELDEDPVETMPDEEFDKILKELRLTIDDNNKPKPAPLEEMTAEEKLQTHLDLSRERIKLERDELEYEKEKFARYKAEYEEIKKLSEESFQAEKEQFERRKQIELKKIYLEAREKISSYKTYEEFIEDYKKILDVSE